MRVYGTRQMGWLVRSAVLGASIVAALATARALAMAELLVTLAALVIVPLGLAVIDAPDRLGRRDLPMRAATKLVIPAGAALTASMLLERGTLAGSLAVPWLAVTLLVALSGARRALARGSVPLAELVIDAGCALLAVAGIWACASRFGVRLLGFDDQWVILTAAHFHFAGFALSVLAGLAGLAGRARPLPRAIGWTLILGPPAVALGITFSPTLEVVGAWSLALASLAFAGWQGLEAARGTELSRASRAALAISSLSLGAGMLLALGFSLANYAGLSRPTIGDMLATHAPLNALGFATCGLIARTLSPRRQLSTGRVRTRDVRPVLGRLRGGGTVGLGFFERLHGRTDRCAGLVDTLDRYAHPGFDPERAHPEVRRFYERTGELTLRVRARWRRAFLPAARLFVALARRFGNLVLPMPEDGVSVVTSSLAMLPDEGARRGGVASERAYANGAPMYIASYAVHAEGGAGFMNIALPLPGACLTSILRMEAHGQHGAILLTSRADEARPDDAGLFLSSRLLTIALPLSEELVLEPAEQATSRPDFADATTTLVARHVFRVLGVICLELDYAIGPS
jgi:hypothetical protein